MKNKKKFILPVMAVAVASQGLVGLAEGEQVINNNTGFDIENDKLDFITTPNIDVVLSVGNTINNVSNFESDLIAELEKLGVDTSKVNIDALKTVETDTNATNAVDVFNEWELFPYNYNGSTLWQYDKNTKTINSPVDPMFETGFVNEKDGLVSKFKMSSDIRFTDSYFQPVGFLFGMHPNESDPTRHDLYYLWVSGNHVNGKSAIAIFKVEGQNFDYLTRPSLSINYHPTTYTALPLAKMGTTFGWTSDWRNYGGFPDTTPIADGSVAVNLVDSGMKTTVLTHVELDTRITNWFNLGLEVDNNKFSVKLNNKEIINYTDNDNPYTSGYMGLFQVSHVNPAFQNMNITSQTTKSFLEVLNSPNWRGDAQKVLVHIDDKEATYFQDTDELNQISPRLNNDGVHLVTFGNDTNISDFKNVINKNSGNGDTFDINDYQDSVTKTAEYIRDLILENQKDVYVLGDKIEINDTDLSKYESSLSEEYPDGKWLVKHDSKYFENGQGLWDKSNAYMNNLDVDFNKVGKYEIFYADRSIKQDIIVHRKPTALFEVKNSDNNLSYSDLSYDLDAISQENKGIVGTEWKYRLTTSEDWLDGTPASINDGEEYIVQLKVKDALGEWSNPYQKLLTAKDLSPFADFELQGYSLTKDQPLLATDKSYSPDFKDVTERVWTIKSGSNVIYTGSELPSDISSFNTGSYSVSLKVKNSGDTWSDEITRTFSVIEDTTPPSKPLINLSTEGHTNQDVTASVDYSEDSEIKLVRYNGLIDESKETYTDKSGQVWNIYEGEYVSTENGYLEAMSIDKAGNESVISKAIINKIDKVNPENPVISSDNEEPTNQDVNINIQYDEDSFYKKYKIDNGEWLDYTGTFLMKHNGTIFAYGLDRAGNQSEIVEYIISNIDKENVDNVSISPDKTAPTNKDVLVTLTSENNEEVYYSVNGGEFIKYETPVVFDDNGNIKAYSIDAVGNLSETKEYTVSNIDKIAPETPIVNQEVTELTNKPYGLQLLNQEDGVNTLYKFNDNDWVSLDATVLNISQNGEYSFKYVDQAGNESEVTVLNIDNFDYEVEDFYLTKEEFNTHGDIYVNVAEDFSDTIYMLVDGEYILLESNKVQVYENGIYTFKCVDELGNEIIKDIEVNLINIIPSIDTLDYPTVMNTPSVVTGIVNNIENPKLDTPKDNEYHEYLLNHLAGLGQEELDKFKGSGTPTIDDVYKFATSGVLSTELGSYDGLGDIIIDNGGFNTLYSTLQELPSVAGSNTLIDLGSGYLQFLEDCGDGYIGGLTIDDINGGTSSPEYIKILNYIDCIPDEDTQNRLRDKLKAQVISIIEDCFDDVDGSGYSLLELVEIGNTFGVLSGYGSGGSGSIDIGGIGSGYISGLIGGLGTDNLSVVGGQILDLIGCGCLNIPDEELTRLTNEFDEKIVEIFNNELDKAKSKPLDEDSLEPLMEIIKCGCMPKETEDYLTGILEEYLKELISNTGSLEELDQIEKFTIDNGIDLTELIEEQRAKIGLVESGGGIDTPEEPAEEPSEEPIQEQPEITEDENIETDIIIPSDNGMNTNSNQVTESNKDLPQTGTEHGTNAGILLLVTGLLGGLLFRRKQDKQDKTE